MPGSLVGVPPSPPPMPPAPPLPLQSNAASSLRHQPESDVLEMSDGDRLLLESAAIWAEADDGTDVSTSMPDVKIASISPAFESLENAISKTGRSTERAIKEDAIQDIPLSSMTDILKRIFQEVKEHGCGRLLLASKRGQLLMEQNGAGIKTSCIQSAEASGTAESLEQNETAVEFHESLDDHLTYAVLHKLYGEEIATQFSLHQNDGEKRKSVDINILPEKFGWAEGDQGPGCDGVYAYKVSEMSCKKILYSAGSDAEVGNAGDVAPVTIIYGIPAGSIANTLNPLPGIKPGTKIEAHMSAANDPHIDPYIDPYIDPHIDPQIDLQIQDEDSLHIKSNSRKAHPDSVNFRNSIDANLERLRETEKTLLKHLETGRNHDAASLLTDIRINLGEYENIVEHLKIAGENSDADSPKIIGLINKLTSMRDIEQKISRYFNDNELIKTTSLRRSRLERRTLSSSAFLPKKPAARSIAPDEMIAAQEFHIRRSKFEKP
jgi:hypothetical protein